MGDGGLFYMPNFDLFYLYLLSLDGYLLHKIGGNGGDVFVDKPTRSSFTPRCFPSVRPDSRLDKSIFIFAFMSSHSWEGLGQS